LANEARWAPLDAAADDVILPADHAAVSAPRRVADVVVTKADAREDSTAYVGGGLCLGLFDTAGPPCTEGG
jgi:hypothetical protein